MLDAILFEKRGLPAAVIITEPFVPTAQAVARMQGMPDFPFIVVPHPITSLGTRQVEALADAITERVETELLRDTSGEPSGGEAPSTESREAFPLTLEPVQLEALEERLAAGIRADGADLKLKLSPPGTVTVTLDIPDEACAECILPREHLEAVFFAILADEIGYGWELEIIDPRE